MSLETSKKILKIFGIIGIIFGIIALVMGIMVFAVGGAVTTNVDMNVEENAAVAGVTLVGGIVTIISAIVAIIEGVCSVRGAKDSSKIMPAWIFAIIGLVFGVINLIGNFGNGASAIVSSIISLLLSVLIFVAANTIKKSN